MIAELGHYALVLAFGLAIVQGTLPMWGAARRDPVLMALGPSVAVVQLGALTLAFAALVFGTGFGTAFPSFMSWVLARTDPQQRAATFGSVLLAQDTAIGCGSLLVGQVGALAGLGTAFLVTAAVSALALPAFLLTRGLLPRDGWRPSHHG